MKKKDYTEVALLILGGGVLGIVIEFVFQVAGCAPGI